MTPHFIDDEKLRARFWGAVGDLCLAAGLKRGESNAIAHAALHVDSVREWGGDPEADMHTSLAAALKVVATYLTVSFPDQQERIDNVARAFETPRLGAVGARRIGGNMTPEQIEAKLAESKKKPLFNGPQASAMPPNPVAGGEIAGADEKPQETPKSAHWATVEANVDMVLAALREIGVNVADARAANGLTPEQPLTDFTGTGREFVAAARAWAERQAQASKPPQPTPVKPPAPPPSSNGYHPLTSADEIRAKYTVKLQGRDYLQVAGRILLFRLDHRLGRIETQLLNASGDAFIFSATIMGADGTVLATGHAMARAENAARFSGRALEKAETSAIGRALAHAGYGTDQAGDDVDEADMLADTPVASA